MSDIEIIETEVMPVEAEEIDLIGDDWKIIPMELNDEGVYVAVEI